MGYCLSSLTILKDISSKSSWQMQATFLNMALNSLYRKQSRDITLINAKYDGENELVETNFAYLDTTDSSSNEYLVGAKEKLNAQQDIDTMRAREIDKIQKEVQIKENQIQTELTQIETQIQATDAELENWKSLRSDQIQKTAGYFK